jgi:hypothetical protein
VSNRGFPQKRSFNIYKFFYYLNLGKIASGKAEIEGTPVSKILTISRQVGN